MEVPLRVPTHLCRVTPARNASEPQEGSPGDAEREPTGAASPSPSPRKNDIAVANGRIAGSREVKGRFARCKTKPAIKTRPKQNLQKVQANERSHQSHHEDGGTDRPQPETFGRKPGSCPCGHTTAMPAHCNESVSVTRTAALVWRMKIMCKGHEFHFELISSEPCWGNLLFVSTSL